QKVARRTRRPSRRCRPRPDRLGPRRPRRAARRRARSRQQEALRRAFGGRGVSGGRVSRIAGAEFARWSLSWLETPNVRRLLRQVLLGAKRRSRSMNEGRDPGVARPAQIFLLWLERPTACPRSAGKAEGFPRNRGPHPKWGPDS